jgi:hypothetical protein
MSNQTKGKTISLDEGQLLRLYGGFGSDRRLSAKLGVKVGLKGGPQPPSGQLLNS